MFAAVGNHVTALHRDRIGGLTAGRSRAGHYRLLDDAAIATVFQA